MMGLTFCEYLTSKNLWRAIFAEFLGTAMIVFLSCGTMLITSRLAMPPSDGCNIFVTAFTTGFAYAMADFILEPMSGGNFNPAFTFGLFCIGRTTAVRLLLYTGAQIFGGIFGSGALYFVCPIDKRAQLGATVLWHNVTKMNGFYIEVICTFLAIFFILCSDEHRDPTAINHHQSAFRVGITFTVLTLAGFPYTTISMNPARSFGPAILSGTWPNHWIYWAGPYIGATMAAIFFKLCWTHKTQYPFCRHTSGIRRGCKAAWGNEEKNIRNIDLDLEVDEDL